MRILLLNDDFPPAGQGGGATIVAALADEDAARGHDVEVLTSHQTGRGDFTLTHGGVRVTSLALRYRPSLRPYLSLVNPTASHKIATFLQSHDRFDAVHAHNVHGFLTYRSLTLAKRRTKRLVVTFHDVMSVSYGRLATDRYLHHGDSHLSITDHLRQAGWTWNPTRRFLIRHALRSADLRVAVSDALRDVLRRNGMRVDRVVRNGIDPSSLHPSPHRMEELARVWGTEGKHVIFFGGRLSRDKGFAELLAAYARLADEIPNVRFLVAGDAAKARSILETIPAARALADRIVLTGWLHREDLHCALALSDLCVTPSICFDSFPTVNLEAMAVGKPVIATCFGGSREVVENGETGFIVNPFESAIFAERLAFLLRNPSAVKRMGEAGRRRIEMKFTLARQAEHYLRLLSDEPEKVTTAVE